MKRFINNWLNPLWIILMFGLVIYLIDNINKEYYHFDPEVIIEGQKEEIEALKAENRRLDLENERSRHHINDLYGQQQDFRSLEDNEDIEIKQVQTKGCHLCHLL